MILDGAVSDADNASLKRISVPDFELRQSKNGVVTSRTEFLNAAGTMWDDLQLYDAMAHPSLACEENFFMSVLEGTLNLNDGAKCACIQQMANSLCLSRWNLRLVLNAR